MKHILVIAEIFEEMIRPVTWELVAAARRIMDLENSGLIKIITLSDDPLSLADKIAEQTGVDVIGLKIPGCMGYDSDVYKQALSWLIKNMEPSHILTAHTSQGRDFAPGLAIRLKAASISGVNKIKSDHKGLIYSRSVLSNNQNMILRPVPGIPVVLTIMPGIFKFDAHENIKKGQMDIFEAPFDFGSDSSGSICHKRIIKKACENKVLKQADIIVSAGRGIGEKENLEKIFQFAKCFSFSAVGASRPLVDTGWIGYEHQVGITGAVVTPKLYIACGISGSSQHLAGMKDTQFVVSINSNPHAPIFRHSDFCIVEDAVEFIQAFLKCKADREY
ncbi:MAG: electron transfer flavoprotein subunit alpha/FixB family protein [Deltaproteobacteria bacterium]|jgi:electron transfer flavoprotein alpha subunit|nr:electron transfer flavoprotein subunit alpha/FixB family protein [Deltaproteobacteria bacterium]